MKRSMFRVLFLPCLIVTGSVCSWIVFAATQTFNGVPGTGCPFGSNWTNVNCWNAFTGPGPVPVTGDDVVIDDPGNNGALFNYDLGSGVQLHSITLNRASADFTLTGGPIVLQSGGFITDGWCNLGTNVFPGVTLNGPTTFTHSTCAFGTLSSVTSFNGAVTGTGPLTLVNNLGDDNLRLTVASTYTGSTTVNGTARVRFDVNGAVPTGSALTVNGSAVFQTSSTIGSLAGGGNVFMNGNNTLTTGGDNTSTTFSGVYQNSGGAAALTKTGAGTLTLSGTNTYTGATTVNAGTLVVNGSVVSPVTVNSGGTLGGSGTINGTVTVNSGGTLSPGNSPGIINTGNLSLTSGSMLDIELDGTMVGTQYDQVNVTGTVDLGGGNLDVGLGFVPPSGFTFIIINNDDGDPVTGNFAGLPEGATFTVSGTQFQISYKGGDGNDVTLTTCTLTCPSDIVVPNTTGVCGANVSFTAPTSSCGDASTCSPAPGSFFPVGMTTVTCTVMGGPSCSFKVTVNDTQPPSITCPPNQTAVTNQNTCPPPGQVPCQIVTFLPPTASDNCPGVSVACNPPSGSCFPTGTTTVTCTATDTSGNTATCTFTTTVFDVCLQDDSNPTRVLLFNSFDYRFCCSGTTFTGKGKVTRQGCIITLEHNPLDRRVRATVDKGVFRGNASLQSPPGRLRCTITDGDIRNNTCACQ